MKYKALILIAILYILAACTDNELLSQDDWWNEDEEFVEQVSSVGTILEIVDDELAEVLAELGVFPYLTSKIEEGSKLAMLNLITGDIMASYDIPEDALVNFIKDLENGYFVVHLIPWFFHENVPDFPFIIFDETLTPVETILFDGETLPFIMDVMKLVDGELFVYGWGWTGDWSGWEDWEDWSHVGNEFLRVNIHTNEVEILFESDYETSTRASTLHKFINSTQILTSALTTVEATGAFSTTVGILDLDIGELIYEFELDSFAILNSDFRASKILFSESLIAPGRERNEVLIFDIESWDHQMVSLGFNNENVLQESFWARLSFDGNHVVTVNIEESVFRKYDIKGVVVAEVEIETGILKSGDVDIHPLNDNIYAIHMWNLLGRHIQIINVP